MVDLKNRIGEPQQVAMSESTFLRHLSPSHRAEFLNLIPEEKAILGSTPYTGKSGHSIADAANKIRTGRKQALDQDDADEGGLSIEVSDKFASAKKYSADGFASSYDALGLVRPSAVSWGGNSNNGVTSFVGFLPGLSILSRHILSKDYTFTYGVRAEYANYKVRDSNTTLNKENNFDLNEITASIVLRGVWTVHKDFAAYLEIAPSFQATWGKGSIVTGAPDTTGHSFTPDNIPNQIIASAEVGIQAGPRDSIHANLHIGIQGSIYPFKPQNVSVEGAASPTVVSNDSSIFIGGLAVVVPFSSINSSIKKIFKSEKSK